MAVSVLHDAEKCKSLCVFHALHAGSHSPTWLPGTLGLLEGGEPETKPLASALLSPAHSASVPSMGGVSSQLWREGRGGSGEGGSYNLHSQHSPLTQNGTLEHTGRKRTEKSFSTEERGVCKCCCGKRRVSVCIQPAITCTRDAWLADSRAEPPDLIYADRLIVGF